MDGAGANLQDPVVVSKPVRTVAFYLPQFHPTPENNAWWGKGFTEWTNVTKAQPLFEGHYQPHLPTDFGFYDLRVRQTRRDQIAVARAHGIDAFCYHYYWFSGRRLLHEPLDDMLSDVESNMPFCICWANESWTRRWDAADHQVLIEQKYLPGDSIQFIRDLAPVFRDARYLKVDGRPLLIVYRVQHMPDAQAAIAVWRAYCHEVGIGDIHVCAALTHGNDSYQQFGCDSGVEFPPHNMRCESVAEQIRFYEPFFGYAVQYADIARSFLQRQYDEGSRIFKTVFPSWDNTARTGTRAVVVLNGTPANYGRWLGATLEAARARSSKQEQLVFINAWNEWAEGCHLEPDRRYGDAFLKATLNSTRLGAYPEVFSDEQLPQSHTRVRGFASDLLNVCSYHAGIALGRVRNRVNRYAFVRAILMPLLKLFRRWF
jgi:lipopolysaccharide biosynthesis protein